MTIHFEGTNSCVKVEDPLDGSLFHAYLELDSALHGYSPRRMI